jgi:hypothetical protein
MKELVSYLFMFWPPLTGLVIGALDRQKRLSLTYETYISGLCNSARAGGGHVDLNDAPDLK